MTDIVFRKGPNEGTRVSVDAELIIGRINADVTLDDPEVSRRHAAIRPRAKGLEIEDLGSLNGIWVNEMRVKDVTPLVGGDRIQIGHSVIEVEGVPADEQSSMSDFETRLRSAPVVPSQAAQPSASELSQPPAPAPPQPEVPAPAPTPAPSAAPLGPLPEASGVVRFTHSGERFVLGYGEAFYGIWDRLTPGEPVQRYPKDPDGWNAAWQLFQAWEPNSMEVATPEPEVSRAPSTPARPWWRTDRAIMIALGVVVAALVVVLILVAKG